VRLIAVAVAVLGTSLVAATTAPSSGSVTSPPAVRAQAPGAPPLLVAAGDIACPAFLPRTATRCHHAAVAALAARLRPAAVALLGDLQYNRGTLSEFRGSFARSWGRLGSRLRPAPGNHEYATPGAAGYYSYFGARAGPGRRGYYSFDVGTWHVVSLNSNCAAVACTPGSAQVRWLRADLAAHRNRCVLAYWHHPRFSSGLRGNDPAVGTFWNELYRARADVVLTGHDHSYERFAALSPAGRVDPVRGIRQFVVGTGGVEQRRFLTPKPGSLRRSTGTYGVLALTLRPAGYSWRFVPEPGRSFTDSGSAACR
jgi:acid phosphatase type 7